MTSAVKIAYPHPAIAEVTIEDRESKNTFSQPVIDGLMTLLSSLAAETKVVVVHGYENYFCCGGTQDELLKLTEGTVTFNELSFYRALLDCELPTIAAMQGHALGGGLAFGSYADIILLAEESLYSTNFMKYGFTPGMGSTYIIPKKFGLLLGHEMLLTAKSYHGIELKQRNVGVNVVKKADVIPTAMTLARELIDKPLISLKLLKKNLADPIRSELDTAIKNELAMHAISFVLPEVKERINRLFGK